MDQSSFAAPHGLSQRITSFIACACQGIHQLPLRHLIVLIANAHPELGLECLSSQLALRGVPNLAIRANMRLPQPFRRLTIMRGTTARLPFTTAPFRCHRRVRYGPCYKRTRRACAWPYLKTSFSRSNPRMRGQATSTRSPIRRRQAFEQPMTLQASGKPDPDQSSLHNVGQNRHLALRTGANLILQEGYPQNSTPHPKGSGGAERDRTADPLLAKQVLSQLSYSPITMPPWTPTNGGPGQTRTADLTLIRRAL